MLPSNKDNVTNKKYKINKDLYEEDDFIKDCPNSNFIPTILPAAKRIIAIGDIHGDLNLAIRSFKLAELIDDNMNWIARPKNTIVVQVGDQIDSCRPIPGIYDCRGRKYPDDNANDVNVINFFNEMHKKALADGGAVYSLIGNHELMNSQGNFTYVSYDNLHNFRYESNDGDVYKGSLGRKKSFEPGGPIAQMLACNRFSILVVGSTMFIHAGILPILASRLDYLNVDSDTKLKYLNSVVRKWLLHKLSKKDQDIKSLFINNSTISPFWTRIYGSIPENTDINSSECFSCVKKTIEVFKLGQIVVGHTPQAFTNKNGINGTCYEKDGSNKLYRVDGGFSRAFKVFGENNMIQVLEIIDDCDFRILTDKTVYKYINPIDSDTNGREINKRSDKSPNKEIVKRINRKMLY